MSIEPITSIEQLRKRIRGLEGALAFLDIGLMYEDYADTLESRDEHRRIEKELKVLRMIEQKYLERHPRFDLERIAARLMMPTVYILAFATLGIPVVGYLIHWFNN